ncbi:MAG: metal-dependent transcriptional regulator [Saccharofermentans sp.]|nr:metal-dependent transcriptional regulator [Saccharofermentans sp.]
MLLMESGEMYLEALYVLSLENDLVRAIDIGEYLGYSKPSVSRAVNLLKNEGFIRKDDRGFLFLTEAGMLIGKSVYERHIVLTDLFLMMGVDVETANQDACRVEHYICDKTFEAVKAYVNDHRLAPGNV